MNVFIVGMEGLGLTELGLVGADYYGPFDTYEEASDFVSLGEYECGENTTPVVLEIENPTPKSKCKEEVCWCHDETRTAPRFCGWCGCFHIG